jgi:uncharacterized protein (DUF4415 family)
MKKVEAEKYRDIDFSRAKRGAVVPLEPGKTKISIRMDNRILEYFRSLVEKAGGGNYQSLINEALREHIHMRSTLEIVRQAVREELAPYSSTRSFDVASEGATAVRNRRRGRIPSSGRPADSGSRRPPSAE